ncbi:MAG: aldehyde dehydrogenase family protein, partial [Nitratireductor sp.]
MNDISNPSSKASTYDSAYINGNWVKATSGATYPVINPASGETLAIVPDMNAEDTRKAITAAHAAQPGWRLMTAKERSAILKRWHRLVVDHVDHLAEIMTAEQGKPLAEAKGEVMFGASYIEWYAEEAKRVYGDIIPEYAPDRRILVQKQPIGVVFAVTPWNFPSAMIPRKCAPALAAGCTVVLKPAEATPLSGLALVKLAEEA